MKALPIIYLFLFAILFTACDNSTDPQEDYMRPTIRQPHSGDTITTAQFNIIVDAEQNCGCTSYMEFYINDEFVYTDYIRDFNYNWNTDTLNGEFLIKVRGVVPNKAEGWDSVRVVVIR